jgi:hypothetical protein
MVGRRAQRIQVDGQPGLNLLLQCARRCTERRQAKGPAGAGQLVQFPVQRIKAGTLPFAAPAFSADFTIRVTVCLACSPTWRSFAASV